MTTKEIAHQLVQGCRRGEFEKVYRDLYHPDVKSVEPEGANFPSVQGLEAIAQKGQQWNEMIEEMHGAEVSDPLVAGNHFTCTMSYDATFKGMGRIKMEEVCVYEVQKGKIVKEQFFYPVQE